MKKTEAVTATGTPIYEHKLSENIVLFLAPCVRHIKKTVKRPAYDEYVLAYALEFVMDGYDAVEEFRKAVDSRTAPYIPFNNEESLQDAMGKILQTAEKAEVERNALESLVWELLEGADEEFLADLRDSCGVPDDLADRFGLPAPEE